MPRCDWMAPGCTMNLAPGTLSMAGIESNSILKVSRLPASKLATRVDSSGISWNINSAKAGVWRQWSSTALNFQNSPVRDSTNSQGPVPAAPRLVSSSPTASTCALLTMYVPLLWGLCRFTSISQAGTSVTTLTVWESTAEAFAHSCPMRLANPPTGLCADSAMVNRTSSEVISP